MIKMVLFDAGEVVIKLHGKFFTNRLAEKQNIPIETVMQFFSTDFQQCLVDQADLREVLPKYFSDWKWTGSVDELLQFWFEAERDLDMEVMAVIKELRDKGIRVGLASDNEKYRGKYLMEEVGLVDKFDKIFFSFQTGFKKSNPGFFAKVIKDSGLNSGEIQYWDDDQKNVDVAAQLGIDGRLFVGIDDLKQTVERI